MYECPHSGFKLIKARGREGQFRTSESPLNKF
jgi:hypothetical protein